MIYTIDELEALPTLYVGHTADLKVDTGTVRVWLSRCGISDGELDPVQVEILRDGRWIDVTTGPDQVIMAEGQGLRHGIRTDGGWIRRGE